MPLLVFVVVIVLDVNFSDPVLLGAEQLSFVGFSQGSALGFACFSLLPHVADKVCVWGGGG